MELTINRFEHSSKIILTILLLLLPVWFLPLPLGGIELGREMTFALLAVLAFILWLLSILMEGRMHILSSPVGWVLALLVAAFGASTFYSRAPFVSLLYAEAGAETFAVFGVSAVLMVMAGSIFRKGKDMMWPLHLLIYSGAIAGLFTILQLLFNINIYGYVADSANGREFNVVGTLNALSVLLAILFMIGTGILLNNGSPSRALRIGLFASLFLFLVNFFLIHFWVSWVVVLISTIVLFGFMFFFRGRFQERSEEHSMGLGRLAALILLAALSVVMLSVNTPLLQQELTAEVSPSFSSTWNIASSVYDGGWKQTALGTGPGTFILNWSAFRDPAINITPFWGVRFIQGFSWVSTLFSTTGVIGTFVFVLFFAMVAVISVRAIMRFAPDEISPYAIPLFTGFIALAVAAFLYPATLTFIYLYFFIAGTTLSAVSKPSLAPIQTVLETVEYEPGQDSLIEKSETEYEPVATGSIWDTRIKDVPFSNSWGVFLSSLVIIFFLSLSVGYGYREIGRLRSGMIQETARVFFDQGRVDEAIGQLERAARYEDKNYRIHFNLLQARIERVRQVIQRAASGINVQDEFQITVSSAMQHAKRAIALYPGNAVLWRTQGTLYELLIPFLPGSERLTLESYREAGSLDPINPVVFVDAGRSSMLFADRLLLTINEAKGSEKDSLTTLRTQSLEAAQESLKKAASLKPDFAAAYFLLSQTSLRLGNLGEAIRNTEQAKITAPDDIGVAFQLGLLYYQTGNIDGAQKEFERAVAINANYSNARYFLGLIYDRRGERGRAIEQFEYVRGFNADNEEVKKILANLKNNKSAFDGIVPPNPPPERRSTPPISDDTTRSGR